MATITLKNGDIREIAIKMAQEWDFMKGDIRLSGVNLFRLLTLKKIIMEKGNTINEAFREVGLRAGGTISEQGLRIPDDKIDEVNKDLSEIALEDVEIEFAPIKLNEGDYLSPDLMEMLLNFIEI